MVEEQEEEQEEVQKRRKKGPTSKARGKARVKDEAEAWRTCHLFNFFTLSTLLNYIRLLVITSAGASSAGLAGFLRSKLLVGLVSALVVLVRVFLPRPAGCLV